MSAKLANPLQYIDRPSTAGERLQWAKDLADEIKRYLIRQVKKNGKPHPLTRGDYKRISIPYHGNVTVQRLFELEQLRDEVMKKVGA